MNRKHLAIAAVAAIVAAILIWLVAFRDGSDATKAEGGGSGTARAGGDRRLPGAGGNDERGGDRDRPPPSIEPVDPDGTLLLEGQVLGGDDQPVAGAQVFLSSQPERTTVTEGDGTFSFDKLLPREYAVTARSEDAIGGPVVIKVGPDVAPVVVRLRDGAGLTVRVTAESGAPVADASVELREMGVKAAKTDAEGKASFRGLATGFTAVEVHASGFAPAEALTTIGSPGTSHELSVVLRKGAAVSGKVIDEDGAAVAEAWVTIQDAAAWIGGKDATTGGADGAFRFDTVAAGSYVMTARHVDHAPGTSEIISVDGINPRDGVVITMKAPGIIRGRVVTSQRQPAPFASVEVGSKGGDGDGFGQGGLTRITAGKDGVFEIKSLPRAVMRVHAENDEAGSRIVDVDLAKTAVVENLELVLDVAGEIAGIVVDSKGEPIAEAQVTASPDVFSSGGAKQIDDLAFSGFTAATTDGGGAFRLHGLPEGTYLLWASRDGTQQQAYSTKGTAAKTGDKGVRIVLPAPGGIEGKLAFADGTPPKRAVVSISVLPVTPVDPSGDFSVRDLPPGNYDIHFRGPDFAEVVQRNLEIKAGAIIDLGTVSVARGRTLGGRVVDGAGAPVVGARVLAGDIVVSQGSGGALDPAIEDQMGLRTAVSGADGAFVILGASPKGGVLIAEDLDRGRSDGMAFPPGDADMMGLTLALHGYGSVSGLVTMKGAPVPNAQIMAAARGGGGHIVVVETGDDGTYVIDKVPEGKHRLDASRRIGISTASTGIDIEVTSGKRTQANIDFPVGTISLAVAVKGKNGVTIDAAQVWLFEGSVVARNAKDIVDHSLAGDPGHVDFWLGVDDVVFKELVAGAYTVCVLPINGDISDQQFQVRLRENLEHLAVVCQPKELTAAPDAQKLTVTTPAMTPLPD